MASCSCFQLSCFVASIDMVFLELKCTSIFLWPSSHPAVKDESRKSEFGRPKSEAESEECEVRSLKSEVGSRKSQVRSRKSEVPPRLSYATDHMSRDKLQDNVARFTWPLQPLFQANFEAIQTFLYSSLVKGCTPIVSCSPTYTSPPRPEKRKKPCYTQLQEVLIFLVAIK